MKEAQLAFTKIVLHIFSIIATFQKFNSCAIIRSICNETNKREFHYS